MDELEQRLRRYRPVGPPPALRARITAANRMPAGGRWTWAPSAAAVAAAFLFYVLAATARHDLAAELTKPDPRREAAVRALAADLGGSDEAGELAARVIEMNEASAVATESGTPLSVEAYGHD